MNPNINTNRKTITDLLSKKWLSTRIAFQIFLVLVFFLNGCTAPPNSSASNFALTPEEETRLNRFFSSLLFENYGAFVLFGSKPLCEMMLVDSAVLEIQQQNYLDKMSQERDGENFGYEFNHNPIEDYEVWKKISQKARPTRYLLVANSEGDQSGTYSLFLVDIQKTALVLEENYEIFKKVAGQDFHPLSIVFELENPNSQFWSKVFQLENHLTKGLLFGFGKKNSILFSWELEFSESPRVVEYLKTNSLQPSTTQTIGFGQGTVNNFTIPIFGSTSEDETVHKYEQEKRQIEKIYRGQNLVKITLEKLFS